MKISDACKLQVAIATLRLIAGKYGPLPAATYEAQARLALADIEKASA